MKAGIVYTSRTGNTERIARALASAFRLEAVPVEQAPDPETFDLLLLGSGVYNGLPDSPMLPYLKRCRRQKIGLFLTMGADPARSRALQRAAELLDQCDIVATFSCRGRYTSRRIEEMKRRPSTSPHAWTPEKAARVAEAQKHPNEIDLARALETFRPLLDLPDNGS